MNSMGHLFDSHRYSYQPIEDVTEFTATYNSIKYTFKVDDAHSDFFIIIRTDSANELYDAYEHVKLFLAECTSMEDMVNDIPDRIREYDNMDMSTTCTDTVELHVDYINAYFNVAILKYKNSIETFND